MEPLHSSLRAGRQAPDDKQAERSGDRDKGVLIHGQKLPDVPCHVCSSEPGDVVAFDMRACEPNRVLLGWKESQQLADLFCVLPQLSRELRRAAGQEDGHNLLLQ